ncbi:MAG TPA: benzoate-CoA ligase family protein [Polyangia bacterium]|jgi:benzoate-CoA ligase family protein|nr:benzoate-CoA ligase family protein [Polyangia bacterium]
MPSAEIPVRFNLAHYLADARIDEGQGDRVALLVGERRLTYADVQDQANRVANLLRALGVAMGQRVLIALPDGVEAVAVFLGTLKAGAVVAMVNPELPAADYAKYLSYTQARVLVTDCALATRAEDVIGAAPHLAATVVVGETCPLGRTVVPYGERVAAASVRFTNADTRADDEAVWFFTSGSTGDPRAAVHAHGHFPFSIERYAKRVLEMSAADVVLSASKLYFGYATGMSLLFPFAVGARSVLFPERATPATLFALAARHRPTLLSTVPTMTAKMIDARAETPSPTLPNPFASVRAAVSAGEALPADLFGRWKATFGVEMLEGLGSVEMFHIFICNRAGDARPGCLGRLVPGYDVRLVRPDGSDAADGEIGTLWVSGGSAALRYAGDPEGTARTMVVRDGRRWIVTSDLLRREGDYFYYQGRSDDMLKVGGVYVSPLEVENVLLQHPAVAECAVIGFEDNAGLVKAKAFVVARDGAPSDDELWDELGRFAREHLAAYKIPRRWERCATLPRNDRGKIMRRLLRS